VEQRVWITRSGDRWHRSPDCPGLLEGQAKAERDGFTTAPPYSVAPSGVGLRDQCKVCWNIPVRAALQRSAGRSKPVADEWDEFAIQVAVNADSDYERVFVERVLRNVTALSPSAIDVQHEVGLLDGRRFRIDFAIRRGTAFKLAIEVDGLEKSPGTRETDLERQARRSSRDNELQNLGWTVLHFTNHQVTTASSECINTIERALERASTPAPIVPSPQPARVIEKHVPVIVERVLERHIPVPAPSSVIDAQAQRSHARPAFRGWIITIIVAVTVAAIATIASISISSLQSGSRAPLANGNCPEDAPIKGNIASSGERIYHLPGSRFYRDTFAEACFIDSDAAERDGFRASRAG